MYPIAKLLWGIIIIYKKKEQNNWSKVKTIWNIFIMWSSPSVQRYSYYGIQNMYECIYVICKKCKSMQ